MAEEQKTNDLPEVENIDMQEELTKLEDEINTLKQVRPLDQLRFRWLDNSAIDIKNEIL